MGPCTADLSLPAEECVLNCKITSAAVQKKEEAPARNEFRLSSNVGCQIEEWCFFAKNVWKYLPYIFQYDSLPGGSKEAGRKRSSKTASSFAFGIHWVSRYVSFRCAHNGKSWWDQLRYRADVRKRREEARKEKEKHAKGHEDAPEDEEEAGKLEKS